MREVIPMSTRETEQALNRLQTDGWIERRDEEIRTTRKWQSAMARAALRLFKAGDPGEDLRVPIALVLYEHYEDSVAEDELASYVEAMLPVEVKALGLLG
jgi:hypothetical protein